MSVYVNLAGCNRVIDVIYRVEAALVAADLPGEAAIYAAKIREIHPHTPETAAAAAPDCVTYRVEDAELAAKG